MEVSPKPTADRRRGLSVARRRDLGACLLFAAAPLLLLRGALGTHRAPGLDGERLYTALYSAAQVRRWLAGLALPGSADVAWDVERFWPAEPAAALLQGLLSALVGDGLALGLTLAAGIWCAGYGVWRLARGQLPAEAGYWPPLLAGLAVQLSPPVLRSAWSADLAVLAVGPASLALASSRNGALLAWSLVAGGWSEAAGLLVAGVSAARRRWLGAAALLPLLVGLGSEPSALPGAARAAQAVSAPVPAYVGVGRAVFPRLQGAEDERLPLGPAAAAPGPIQPHDSHSGLPPEPPSLPPLAAPVQVQPGPLALLGRVHGGPLAMIACLLALFLRPSRPWGVLGLASVALLTAGLGWMPLPGEQPSGPSAWIVGALGWLPGWTGSPTDWLLPAVLGAGLGLGALAAVNAPAGIAAAVAVLVATPLQPLRPGLPITNLPPEPAVEALRDLPAGGVLHLPDPARPYLQQPHSVAELLYLATRHGHPVPTGAAPAPDPALVAHAATLIDASLDQRAAEAIWQARHLPPLVAAREAGFVGLLADKRYGDALLADDLQQRLGPPLAEGAIWRAHVIGEEQGD